MTQIVERTKAIVGAPTWRGWQVMEDQVQAILDEHKFDKAGMVKAMQDAWHRAATTGTPQNAWDAVADVALIHLLTKTFRCCEADEQA